MFNSSTGRLSRLPHWLWMLAALGAALLASIAPALSASKYACENDLIEVMFAPESQVRLRGGVLVDLRTKAVDALPAVLDRLAWHEWTRLADVPEDRLDAMNAEAVSRSGHSVYNLNNAYRLRIPPEHDVWSVSEQLEATPGIIHARPVPKPMPLPLPPDFEPLQKYLLAADQIPTGIDAVYANGLPGGDGTGVTVCDLEYSWNYSHADIPKALGSQINPNIVDPFNNTNHGTAVIGELVADRNGWGTSGVCPGANLLTCGTYYPDPFPTWNVAGAIILAASFMNPGDVILIEQQWDYTGTGGYVPIEWWTSTDPSGQSFNTVYAAILQTTSKGINVVEAGGNGNRNTDLMSWYGHSGAIIVGAGGAYPGGSWGEGNLERLSFSSYGSRFDMQGWGENVTTTGYGYMYAGMGTDYYYTSTFAGTSSASPIVAGAVACCVGYWNTNVSPTPPTPAYIATVLTSTGTAQVSPETGIIGPRPDLRAAFDAILPPCSCPYQSDFNADSIRTSEDLNALINIVFFNGVDPQDPQCPAFRSDFNCDGVPDATDFNDLISLLFFNGPPPCDPCACSSYPTSCP